MTLWLLGFPNAEARKGSIMALNRGDLFRYFDFHLAQSVPAGALFASSRSSISLRWRLVPLSFKGHGKGSTEQESSDRGTNANGLKSWLTVQAWAGPGLADRIIRVQQYG